MRFVTGTVRIMLMLKDKRLQTNMETFRQTTKTGKASPKPYTDKVR